MKYVQELVSGTVEDMIKLAIVFKRKDIKITEGNF
jgi:hypothetical protein